MSIFIAVLFGVLPSCLKEIKVCYENNFFVYQCCSCMNDTCCDNWSDGNSERTLYQLCRSVFLYLLEYIYYLNNYSLIWYNNILMTTMDNTPLMVSSTDKYLDLSSCILGSYVGILASMIIKICLVILNMIQ